MTSTDTIAFDLGGTGVRLAIDLLAVAALAGGIYYRRHGRRDLFVTYIAFNAGVFLALAVIASSRISAGVGFGLFALLSIIRLRSEPFANVELAYFFLALVLAIGTGIDLGGAAPAAALAITVVTLAAAVDHPRLMRATRRMDVTVEFACGDEDDLRRRLGGRLGGRVLAARIVEVDWVREITRASLTVAADLPPSPRPVPLRPADDQETHGAVVAVGAR